MTTPRRIAIVIQSTSPGGMETHALDLAAEYARRRLPVSVVLPDGDRFDVLASRAAAAGAAVTRCTTDGRHGRRAQLGGLWTFARQMRRWKPGVTHLHTGGATGGLAVVALSRWVGRATTVITEHDVPVERPGRAHRLTRGLLDRSAHAVVAVSRRNAALRHARLPVKSRVFASVLNGVPLPGELARAQAGAMEVRAALGIAPGEVVVGSLVRLAEGKGLDTLLDAFSMVHRARPCRLLLVGDGPLRGALEEQAARLGVADAVTFSGSQRDPQPYLAAMDVFVLAVPAGSMSIALLEAMALGLPPVITFCGPEEAVIPGETGLGAPPNDPGALAAAIGSLVGDPALRRQLGLAARSHVGRHFSVGRVADDLLAVYEAGRTGVLPRRLDPAGPPTPYPGGTDQDERAA
jgi:glycosyltransferase involved in cell wall biosynthesis